MSSPNDGKSRVLGKFIASKIKREFPRANLGVLHEPVFGGRELEYTSQCIESGFVSSVGQFVNQFEEQLSHRFEGRSVVATNTGTSALHLALIGAGVAEGDEVIIPAATFVATANAVRMCGAIPHFVDIESSSMALDAQLLEEYLGEVLEQRSGGQFNKKTGRRVSAVVVVHLFGHSAPVESILTVTRPYGFPLVEDAAEAVGSLYEDRPVGTSSGLAALSFNGNKIVTTGGGGAVVAEDASVALLLKHLSTTAKKPHPWEYFHDLPGFNYRMPNINAALGCAQLEQLDSFVEAKRSLVGRYAIALGDVGDVELVTEPSRGRSNYWLQTILLDRSQDLPSVLGALHEEGIGARPLWKPLHQLPMYERCPRSSLGVTESLSERLINLPSGVGVAI